MPIYPKQQPPYYTKDGLSLLYTYVALLTQASTNPPTAIILQNSIPGDDPVWTYLNTGHYQLTKTGIFIAAQMDCIPGQTGAPNGFTNVDLSLTPNAIVLDTYILVLSGVPDVAIQYSNGILNKTPIYIHIYG